MNALWNKVRSHETPFWLAAGLAAFLFIIPAWAGHVPSCAKAEVIVSQQLQSDPSLWQAWELLGADAERFVAAYNAFDRPTNYEADRVLAVRSGRGLRAYMAMIIFEKDGCVQHYDVLNDDIIETLLGGIQPAQFGRFPRHPYCGERDKFLLELRGQYSEQITARGLTLMGDVLEILSGPEGSWTLLLTNPRGQTCMTETGEAWSQWDAESLPDPIPGAREG